MQIVEYGYGNIASKLNGLPNKHEITSLTLKNTVLFHSNDYYLNKTHIIYVFIFSRLRFMLIKNI